MSEILNTIDTKARQSIQAYFPTDITDVRIYISEPKRFDTRSVTAISSRDHFDSQCFNLRSLVIEALKTVCQGVSHARQLSVLTLKQGDPEQICYVIDKAVRKYCLANNFLCHQALMSDNLAWKILRKKGFPEERCTGYVWIREKQPFEQPLL